MWRCGDAVLVTGLGRTRKGAAIFYDRLAKECSGFIPAESKNFQLTVRECSYRRSIILFESAPLLRHRLSRLEGADVGLDRGSDRRRQSGIGKHSPGRFKR